MGATRWVRYGLSSVLISGLLVTGVTAQTPAPEPTPVFAPDTIPDGEAVLRVIKRSASAEVARMTAIEANPQGQRNGVSTNWIAATFFVGAMKLNAVADVPDVRDYSLRTARRFNYALQGDGAPVHLLNADDQAIGDLYQAVYLHTGSPGTLMPLQQRLDFTLPYLSKAPEPDKLVWWWCDSLFMAPPVLARMSAITGDPKYIRAMDVQWWRTYERLYDKEQHLYARDERFIERRSPNGKKIFWARGEGWVLAGLARVLEVMPEDFPTRPRYVQLFQEMSARIITLQQPDGLWRASLLDTEAFPEPETSGTAFYTYALAFGINHGLLDRKTYLPYVLKSWAGLNHYVLPNGILGQVQSAGDQPVPTKRDGTALYASGGFLLAGLEVMNLGGPVTALPIALPKPATLDYHASDMRPSAPLPADATEEQKFQFERREAEREAVKKYAYDPMVDDKDWVSPVAAKTIGSGLVKLVPATEAERKPRATVRFAPDRFDDILWENDRVAHRIYGPALEAREPPSGSGIDVWSKRVRWPFMDRQLATKAYHNDQGEGADAYNVKGTRGGGGLGIWLDNKLWTSRTFRTYKILQNGPDVAKFSVTYDPWPVGVDRKVWESRTFTLPLGTNFTRLQSTLSSDKPDELIVGIGLGKGATVPGKGGLFIDKARGIITYWEPNDPDHGSLGTAVRVDPASVVDIKADADNNLILIRVTPGKPFVYYIGSAWDQGLDFHSREEWEAYVKAEKLSFKPE
ncbi:glycoside hydrolase family 88 protein [Asticcacaulis sp. BYS171W]|uniref:Glycoside hydrolase family 88 protein n=1 Tax=Asticcacaulis aquaticus TaxID=2984212 RepID=A0ABT5HX61_9CAUL|nr:glycoside hydrolase family 88 protein [Asticcacaulis aquaticus]MDC7684618.1 glycoside hydrolase family 88 protein [Asticcacaulis aquaticus]